MLSFKAEKLKVLTCLASGHILHDARANIDVKNLLLTGAVSIHYVSEIISQARGNEFQVRPHHMVAGVDVNIIRTIFRGQSWYIKWYFMEPDCVFISVHN